jgi:hypothetical protein
MRVSELLIGRREFKTEPEVIQIITSSKKYEPSKESIADAEAKLIFQTSKQQTWLVFTNEKLYCILDDISKGTTKVNWAIPKKDIVKEGKITIKLSSRDKSSKTGLVDIGTNHKNWLFSKCLFTEKSIEESIKELISKRML